MAVAIRSLQSAGIPAGKHEVVAIRLQTSGKRLSKAATGTGDQYGGHSLAICKRSG